MNEQTSQVQLVRVFCHEVAPGIKLFIISNSYDFSGLCVRRKKGSLGFALHWHLDQEDGEIGSEVDGEEDEDPAPSAPLLCASYCRTVLGMHALPCPGPRENGCSGPENFQDWLPRPTPTFFSFAPPCPDARKGCPVHPWTGHQHSWNCGRFDLCPD